MKTDIVFIFPTYYGNFSFHLGSSYIIAYLRQKGINARQFISYEPLKIDEVARAILDKKPGVVGFSCYDSNYFLIKLLSRHIKTVAPETLIILGGPTATFSYELILKNAPWVDLCVRHEGEYPTYEIIEALKKGRDLSNIKGISFRDGGKIIRNQERPLIKRDTCRGSELDILPSPYISGAIDPAELVKNKDSVSIIASRGCPHKCSYCNFRIMFGSRVRYHSVERIMDELRIINRLSGRRNEFIVTFEDDTFTSNRERIRGICRRIIDEGIDLTFSIATRADYVDEKLLKLLYKAGVRYINFGLESAVPRILYNIKKIRSGNGAKNRFAPERKFINKMESAVSAAKAIGFKVNLGVIFGLPGETFKDGMKTIGFVKRLNVDTYAHNILILYAGTEMFRAFTKKGLVPLESRLNPQFNKVSNSGAAHKYDVRRIPRLKNDYYSKNKIVRLPVVSRGLTGLYSDDALKGGAITDVILPVKRISSEWLIKNCHLKTSFMFGKRLKNIFSASRARLKILNYNLASILAGRNYDKDIDTDRLFERYLDIYKHDFEYKRLFLFRECRQDKNFQGVKLFQIKDARDVDELERHLVFIKEKGITKFSKRINFDYLILDLCRWSGVCPGLRMARMVVKDNLEICACFDGAPVGMIGDRPWDMKKAIAGHYNKEIKIRGCRSCPVRVNCSKCALLGGIGRGRFCEIRIKYNSEIKDYTKLLNSRISLRYSSALTYR